MALSLILLQVITEILETPQRNNYLSLVQL